MKTTQRDIDAVMAGHRELRDLIEDLELYLARPRPEVGSEAAHQWASGLAEVLVRMHDLAFRHFREEEKSGVFEQLARQKPRAAGALEALRSDHDRILCDLRSLLGAALSYSGGVEPEKPQLRAWTKSILDTLRRHESEETELFQDLEYQELGSGD